MDRNTYRPDPIDTAHVHLDDEAKELVEKLARNTHEVWAKKRIAEGWRYGHRRDDGRREHPCLVPYDQLPESEKSYDRDVVIETLKGALALGFRLTRASQFPADH